MSDAVGKICPYCQTPIKPDESVVYCSACAIPHHRQCWSENGGCTTFGCGGQALSMPVQNRFTDRVMDIDVGSGSPADTRYCSYCGTRVMLQDRRCHSCGNLLPELQMAAAYSPEMRIYPGPVAYQGDSGTVYYPKASSLKRFFASLLDGLVCFAAYIPMLIAVEADTGFYYFLGILGIIWAFWYNFTKDGWGNGQSIGKKALGLMVVNLKTNQACTKGTSALRVLLWIIPYIGGFIALADCIMILASENGRRVGDHVAGTQVISAEDYPFSN